MNDLKKIETAYKKEIINKGKDVLKVIERVENLLRNVYVRTAIVKQTVNKLPINGYSLRMRKLNELFNA